jgi:hypothetical protein
MCGFTLALSSYFDFIYLSLSECYDINQHAIIQITTNDGNRGRCRHMLYTRSGGAIVTKQDQCSSWICHPGGAVTHAL